LTDKRPVIIIGSGGHSKVLIAALQQSKRKMLGILSGDPKQAEINIMGVPVLGGDESIKEFASESVELINGVGSISIPEKRKDIFIKFKKAGYQFASVIHPAACIMKDVRLGEGVQIMAGAIVQPGCSIGENVIINTGAIVDHDCIIGSHVHIAPGAVLSGGVQIGDLSHVGTAATIIQGIKIGRSTLIGAGAVVHRDMPSRVKAAGVPARLLETKPR